MVPDSSRRQLARRLRNVRYIGMRLPKRSDGTFGQACRIAFASLR
jgi:hypothetical protein